MEIHNENENSSQYLNREASEQLEFESERILKNPDTAENQIDSIRTEEIAINDNELFNMANESPPSINESGTNSAVLNEIESAKVEEKLIKNESNFDNANATEYTSSKDGVAEKINHTSDDDLLKIYSNNKDENALNRYLQNVYKSKKYSKMAFLNDVILKRDGLENSSPVREAPSVLDETLEKHSDSRGSSTNLVEIEEIPQIDSGNCNEDSQMCSSETNEIKENEGNVECGVFREENIETNLDLTDFVQNKAQAVKAETEVTEEYTNGPDELNEPVHEQGPIFTTNATNEVTNLNLDESIQLEIKESISISDDKCVGHEEMQLESSLKYAVDKEPDIIDQVVNTDNLVEINKPEFSQCSADDSISNRVESSEFNVLTKEEVPEKENETETKNQIEITNTTGLSNSSELDCVQINENTRHDSIIEDTLSEPKALLDFQVPIEEDSSNIELNTQADLLDDGLEFNNEIEKYASLENQTEELKSYAEKITIVQQKNSQFVVRDSFDNSHEIDEKNLPQVEIREPLNEPDIESGFARDEHAKLSVNFADDMVKLIDTKTVKKTLPPIPTARKERPPPLKLNHDAASFSTDSLSVNSSEKNDGTNEKSVYKSIAKADKNFNKWYQPNKSSTEAKKTTSPKVTVKTKDLPPKIFPTTKLPTKVNSTKVAIDSTNEASPVAKSAKPFYLIKNRPILVPGSSMGPRNTTSLNSRPTNELLPRRAQNDLRKQNSTNVTSKSTDPKNFLVSAEDSNSKSAPYEKIRVYKKQRWTSESPVKNYIDFGRKTTPKRSPATEVNYYNRISLISNKLNQLNRDNSSPTRTRETSLYTQQSKYSPFLGMNTSPFVKYDPFIPSVNANSFMLRSRPLANSNLHHQQHREDIHSDSFEFLRNFFYLNEKIREEKYSKTRIPIKEGSNLSTQKEKLANYSYNPFSYYDKTLKHDFCSTWKSQMRKFYTNYLKWLFNVKNAEKDKLSEPTKLMITDYEDLFRNMKATDLENKVRCPQSDNHRFHSKIDKTATKASTNQSFFVKVTF